MADSMKYFAQRILMIGMLICSYGCDRTSEQAKQRNRALRELMQKEIGTEEENLNLVAIKYDLSAVQVQGILNGYRRIHHPLEFQLAQEMHLRKAIPIAEGQDNVGETVPETIRRLADEYNVSPKVIASLLVDLDMVDAIKRIDYRSD